VPPLWLPRTPREVARAFGEDSIIPPPGARRPPGAALPISFGALLTDNVAHSIRVPALNLVVCNPEQDTTRFTVDIRRSGEFVWLCVEPCGTGADPYNTLPMDVPGFMTGRMTVT